MANKLTQIELLNLAFEGVEARETQNKQLKDIIVEMYKEEVAKQAAQEVAQTQKTDNSENATVVEQE